MTLLELVTNLRTMLDDKGGDKDVDWTDEANIRLLRWSNATLVDYINEAERETATRTLVLTDASTVDIVEIDIVVASTALYDLSPKILHVRRAKQDAYPLSLRQVSWKDLESLDNEWTTRVGQPTMYILDWAKDKILLYPIPKVVDKLRLNVYRLPLDDMSRDSWEAEEPEIPEEYQIKMLSWAAHLAYNVDEPNILDPKRSEYFELKYDREIGPAVSMYSVDRKKKPKRQIRYGGIQIIPIGTRGNRYTAKY